MTRPAIAAPYRPPPQLISPSAIRHGLLTLREDIRMIHERPQSPAPSNAADRRTFLVMAGALAASAALPATPASALATAASHPANLAFQGACGGPWA